MISSISGFLNLNHLDMTSDANDVIVVRHPDGRLYSTPFNVRFGKVKVLRPSEKMVRVEVNGALTSAVMKMGPDGEAFWLKPIHSTDGDNGRPESPVVAAAFGLTDLGSTPKDVLHPLSAETEQGARVSAAADAIEGRAVSHSPIEEDCDGDLKENAAACHSVKDANEMQLVGETAVAVEGAMPHTSELGVADNEHLRETGKEKRMFSLSLAPGLNDQTLFHGFQNEGGFTTSFLSACAADGDEMPKVTTSVAVESMGAYTMVEDEVQTAVAAGEAPMPEEQLMVSNSGSLAASDEGFDELTDDYLLEDATIADEHFLFELESASLKTENSIKTAAAGALHHEDQEFFPELHRGGSNASRGRCNKYSDGSVDGCNAVYFTRTLIPTEADLQKLNLVEQHNRVRYITQSSLRGEVTVEANVYLWDSTDRLVVSDIDGTVTKSDVWGHLMPLFGRDWTHPGICALYSKISQNGYKFVYLTSRSVSQVSMTRKFLWNIEQDGYRLPKGPVLTAPQRFFTALTQEVSKKSHVFKIACLKSVLDTFPVQSKPFYAGFGNRFNDVVSYTATKIPQHKIFIIDPNSVLHVYKVKQTYNNLAHLVDVTFPPVVKKRHHHYSHRHAIFDSKNSKAGAAVLPNTDNSLTRDASSCGSTLMEGSDSQSSCGGDGPSCTSPIDSKTFWPGDNGECESDTPVPKIPHEGVDVAIDQDFHSFLYWRVPPADLLQGQTPEGRGGAAGAKKKQGNVEGTRSNLWLAFSLMSNGNNNSNTHGRETIRSGDYNQVRGSDRPAAAPQQRQPTEVTGVLMPGGDFLDSYDATTETCFTPRLGGKRVEGIKPYSDGAGKLGTAAPSLTGKSSDHVVAGTTAADGPTTFPFPPTNQLSDAVGIPNKEGSSRGWLFWKSTDTSLTRTSMESSVATGEDEEMGNEAAFGSYAPREASGNE